jgi:acetamidase/formamidase
MSAVVPAARPLRHDAYLRSTPEIVPWGQIAANRAPVLRIESGQIVGMAPDLDTALRNAVTETAVFLRQRAGLSAAEAYALCSLAADFRIGEAVNSVVMVYGMIPKKVIRGDAEYWT